MNSKTKTGLILLSLLLLCLFNQPLMGIASGSVAGVPAAMLYLTIGWLLLILLMAWWAKKSQEKGEH